MESEPDPPVESEPDPTPSPIALTGTLTFCELRWCLDGLPLDLGDSDFLAGTAGADLDGDGDLRSYFDEINGLVGTEVRVIVAPDTAPAQVLVLNGLPYDGSGK